MSNPTEKKPRKGQQSVTWAQAFRDVVIASMNRGQLPILGIIGVVLVLIYRMPEQDVSVLVMEIVSSLKKGEGYAYILEGVTIGGWFLHAKLMRKVFSTEAERIGREKSHAQSKAAGTNFKSSEKK